MEQGRFKRGKLLTLCKTRSLLESNANLKREGTTINQMAFFLSTFLRLCLNNLARANEMNFENKSKYNTFCDNNVNLLRNYAIRFAFNGAILPVSH